MHQQHLLFSLMSWKSNLQQSKFCQIFRNAASVHSHHLLFWNNCNTEHETQTCLNFVLISGFNLFCLGQCPSTLQKDAKLTLCYFVFDHSVQMHCIIRQKVLMSSQVIRITSNVESGTPLQKHLVNLLCEMLVLLLMFNKSHEEKQLLMASILMYNFLTWISRHYNCCHLFLTYWSDPFIYTWQIVSVLTD